jgi:hypothetical protein
MEPKYLDEEDDVGYKVGKLKLTEKAGRMDAKSLPPKSDESRVAEAKLDLEVEREWKSLQNDTVGGRIEVSTNPRAKKICKGLTMCVA